MVGWAQARHEFRRNYQRRTARPDRFECKYRRQSCLRSCHRGQSTVGQCDPEECAYREFRVGAARFPCRLGQSAAGGKHDPKNSMISETPKNESSTFEFNLDNVPVSESLPVVPTSLTATEVRLQQDTAQVTLGWLPSQFATSYTVKRAGSPQGPFFPIGNTTNSSFVDDVSGGMTYYYIVSASNQNWKSADSVAVTPVLSTGITLTAGTI